MIEKKHLSSMVSISIFCGLMLHFESLKANKVSTSEDTDIKHLVANEPEAQIPYNVSHYIYHDLNLNGIYDYNDRILSGIGVTLSKPDGTRIVRKSNIHGFVNFTTMYDNPFADISMPGEYVFTINTPNKWIVTSNNPIQKILFNTDPESRSGIVAVATPDPAGLVQVLAVSGTPKLATVTGDTVTSTELIVYFNNDEQSLSPLVTAIDQKFLQPLKPGKWQVEFIHKDRSAKLLLDVIVNNTPIHFGNLKIGQAAKHRSDNLLDFTENFENITRAIISKVPLQSNGLKWTNMIAVENTTYRGDGYVNNTMSGHYIGYNTSGYPVTVERKKPFDFLGAYFGVAWPGGDGENLISKAWHEDTLISTDIIPLSVHGPIWFQANYSNITKLELSTEHYWQFVTDDMTFRL
ncbi:MAG: hypothetical protein KKC01_09885 [Gammaproteobacteria bacterium]|nr:hypothetical protein [Gammaproteobacteria bacterium]